LVFIFFWLFNVHILFSNFCFYRMWRAYLMQLLRWFSSLQFKRKRRATAAQFCNHIIILRVHVLYLIVDLFNLRDFGMLFFKLIFHYYKGYTFMYVGKLLIILFLSCYTTGFLSCNPFRLLYWPLRFCTGITLNGDSCY
jgi:hypothetical protein